jgi:hypothetical protein
MAGSKVIEWQAYEHHHEHHSEDWFWIVGIVALIGAILAAYFGNIMLAILIVIAGFTSFLHGHSTPRVITFRITRRGVQAGDTMFPFSTLESFWVIDEEVDDRIILKSQKFMMPYIVLPYDSTTTDPESIRDYLLEYIDEEEMDEPVMQKVMENLGF